jgi:hypothetical protein
MKFDIAKVVMQNIAIQVLPDLPAVGRFVYPMTDSTNENRIVILTMNGYGIYSPTLRAIGRPSVLVGKRIKCQAY